MSGTSALRPGFAGGLGAPEFPAAALFEILRRLNGSFLRCGV